MRSCAQKTPWVNVDGKTDRQTYVRTETCTPKSPMLKQVRQLQETETPRDAKPPLPHINAYNNYVPLCLVGLAGLTLYIYFNWGSNSADNKSAKPVNLPPGNLPPATRTADRM